MALTLAEQTAQKILDKVTVTCGTSFNMEPASNLNSQIIAEIIETEMGFDQMLGLLKRINQNVQKVTSGEISLDEYFGKSICLNAEAAVLIFKQLPPRVEPPL